jgi:hypothetical protein
MAAGDTTVGIGPTPNAAVPTIFGRARRRRPPGRAFGWSVLSQLLCLRQSGLSLHSVPREAEVPNIHDKVRRGAPRLGSQSLINDLLETRLGLRPAND